MAGLLGPVAHAALARNETTPGLRATGDGSPLSTLTRLWPMQAPVPEAAAAAALPGLLDPLCAQGFLWRSAGEVRARVDIRPYADDARGWWVVADLTPGLDGAPVAVAPDHVLGVSPASTTLAQLTPRLPAGRALDLGTGSGVQALHLTAHCDEVVATDVNPRAVALARVTAALNQVTVDVREGDLDAPVSAERFDLVVTNPPFVISPGTGERLVYRDSGLPGDQLVRRVLARTPGLLCPGGMAVVLANWAHREGRPWEERVRGWVDPAECDAWAVQREVLDPAQYVELWLRDAGHDASPDYTRRYDEWLSWFAQQRVTGVGFGWVALRRAEGVRGLVCLEDWPHEVEQPLGAELVAWGRRCDVLRSSTPDQLLDVRWVARADVRQETHGPPGAADPEAVVLRQQRGMRRARAVTTVEAALVGASDGELSARQIVRAVAALSGDRPDEPAAARSVRALVEAGFLEGPVDARR